MRDLKFYELMIYQFALYYIIQVRTVREVHRQPGHFGVVLTYLESGSLDSVRFDHVLDRRVHVVHR